MGFLTRAFVPRGVRRAAHPVRTAKSAATPRVVKQARSALNPIDSAVYSAERALNTTAHKSQPRKSRVVEPETTNSPETNRKITQIAYAAIIAVIVTYVVASLIFGWAVVLVCTIAIVIFGVWVAKEIGEAINS